MASAFLRDQVVPSPLVVPSINPVRGLVVAVGALLAKLGLVDKRRAERAADLSWPRIVTGLARMSKNAVDVAMVGVAVGTPAIAGVGFASPFWGLAFSMGGGLAAGTIALVSQRYGANAYDGIGQTLRSSAALVVVATLPLSLCFYAFAPELVGLLTSDARPLQYGTTYLRWVSLGVPFAALNLVGSRAYIGVDDAWTPMLVRAGGAVTNIALNAILIFGVGMGVAGAAAGTVLANVAVTLTFATGLVRGSLPATRPFPTSVNPIGRYVDLGLSREIVTIGLPVVGRNSVWTAARFPMLAIVGMYPAGVVAAYVVARRIRGLMNTPGWGFGLAASSLVGQSLGAEEEDEAAAYGREITLVAVGTYLVGAVATVAFAPQIVRLFVEDPADPAVPIAIGLVYAAAVAIIPQAIKSTIAGALDATGDTRWPFYSQVLGMIVTAIPLAYIGATTALGLWGLYLAFLAESLIPAIINYYRFASGEWKIISRAYRPDAAPADD